MGAPQSRLGARPPTLLRGKASAPTLGGCPPPIQFPLQRCSHLEPPPHLEDPDHRPSAGSAASKDLCLCNCLGVARGLLPSPIPRASLTLSPCRIIPLPPHPDSGKDQLCTPLALQVLEAVLGPKAPPLALLCPHLDPPTPRQILSPSGCSIPHPEASRWSGRQQGLGEGRPRPG